MKFIILVAILAVSFSGVWGRETSSNTGGRGQSSNGKQQTKSEPTLLDRIAQLLGIPLPAGVKLADLLDILEKLPSFDEAETCLAMELQSQISKACPSTHAPESGVPVDAVDYYLDMIDCLANKLDSASDTFMDPAKLKKAIQDIISKSDLPLDKKTMAQMTFGTCTALNLADMICPVPNNQAPSREGSRTTAKPSRTTTPRYNPAPAYQQSSYLDMIFPYLNMAALNVAINDAQQLVCMIVALVGGCSR